MYKKIIFRLFVDTTPIGSAVCFSNESYSYVITAYHCIEQQKKLKKLKKQLNGKTILRTNASRSGTELQAYDIKKLSVVNHTEKDFRITLENFELLIDDRNDLAVFVLNEEKKYLVNINDFGCLTRLGFFDKSGAGVIIGYPKIYDSTSISKNELRVIDASSFRTHNSDNNRFFCTSLRDDQYKSVVGISGGAVFYEGNFCGIETNYLEETKDFFVINVSAINDLLKKSKHSLPLLLNSFNPKTNTGISLQILQKTFSSAKTSWLSQRYNIRTRRPNFGKISELADELLYNSSHIQKWNRKLVKFFKESILKSLNEIYYINDEISSQADSALKSQINDIVLKVNPLIILINGDVMNQYNQFLEQVLKGEYLSRPELIDVEEWGELQKEVVEDLDAFLSDLKDKGIEGVYSDFANSLRYIIKDIDLLKINEFYESVYKENHPHNYIILGKPSAGKTHGCANVIDSLLNDRGEPALILSASAVDSTSWQAVLTTGLGLPDKYSEEEIFSDLSALAELYSENKLFLIVVDGIDESKEREQWIERINELVNFIETYPQVRFIVTARRYPSEANPCELIVDNEVNILFDLQSNTDVPLKELIDIYFEAYKIPKPYSHAKGMLSQFDPLLLRLFCENYKLLNPGKLLFTYKDLIVIKIKKLEKEFRATASPEWDKVDDHMILGKALKTIAKSLELKYLMKRGELSNEVAQEISQNSNWAGRILELFDKHEFISKIYTKENELVPEIYYEAANQVFVDEVVSEIQMDETIQRIIKGDKKASSGILKNRNIALKTAIKLLVEQNKWIGEDDIWVNDFEEDQLLILKLEALSYTGNNKLISERFTEIEGLFKLSTTNRNIVFEHFVCKNEDRRTLGIGNKFLHDALMSFGSVYKRDLFWSSPEYRGDDSIGISEIHRNYILEDMYVDAWCLSTLDNDYREHLCESLLMRANNDIIKFVSVLDLIFFNSKDPQIQEDLSSVVLGLATLNSTPSSEFKLLTNWIVENIFKKERIANIRNSVVRYCMRAAVERAKTLGLCSKEDVELSRPPYAIDNKLLNLDFDFKAVPGGTGELDTLLYGDLAWYVIEKSYSRFLELSNNNQEVTKLLDEYSKHYKNKIHPDLFATSAAIAFAKGLGWKKGEKMRLTTQKTHGQKSQWATYEEKYVWLAVHEIQGYLADRVNFDNTGKRIKDYGLIVNVYNPASSIDLKRRKSLLLKTLHLL